MWYQFLETISSLPSECSNSNSKDTISHPGPVNSSKEEIEQEIANVESQIDSAVISEDFELAGILYTLKQIIEMLEAHQ